MTDIIFVNPPSPDGSVIIRDMDRSGRKSRENTIWPQVNLAYLAAMVDDKHSVDIVDCIAEKMDWPAFIKKLKTAPPKYLVTNVISSTLSNDLKAAKYAKELGATTIAIGAHVTALPEDTLNNFSYMDFIIIGEAEITFKKLIDSLELDRNFDRIKGLAYRQNSFVKINEKREVISNLDDLPIPRHDLLPIDKHNLPFIGRHYTFVTASRGCPYPCTFCRSPVMWDHKVRSRSATSIMKELRTLNDLGIKNFMFHSDTFTINKDIVIDLCKMIIDEGLKFKWICNSRVDTLDKEMLQWMKKAGCWMIAYGIESGSQKILDNVKKNITLKQSEDAVQETIEAGIKVWGYFIIGLPGETKETIEETIAFAMKLPLDLANFAVGAPYPGTEFYDMVKEKGWLNAEKWEDYDQNCSAVVDYDNLSGDEIMAGIQKAYKKWYGRPKVVFNIVTSIRNLSDIKTLTHVALNHLKIHS